MTTDELKIIIPSSLDQINILTANNDNVINLAIDEGEAINLLIKEGLGHGVVSSINNHKDVAITNIQDKDNLVYNSITGKWENKIILRYIPEYKAYEIEE